MEQRMDLEQVVPEGLKKVLGLQAYVNRNVDHGLLELVKLRASMINGCAHCVDMHTTDLLEGGEDPRKVVAVSAWREAPFFTDQERIVLAMTDAVTRLGEEGVEDELWAEAQKELGDEGLANLLLAIATINVWNRLAVPARLATPPLAG